MICSCDKPGDCLLISKSNIHHPREVAVYSAQPPRYQIYVKYTAGDFDHGGVHAVHVEGCIVCIIIKGSLKKIGQSWDFVPTRGVCVCVCVCVTQYQLFKTTTIQNGDFVGILS